MDIKTKDSKVDITGFDAVAKSSRGFTFELKGEDGISPTGVRLTILGKHADEVAKWTAVVVNKMIRDAEYAKRRGKPVDPESLEDIKEKNIKGALIRVIGWENVEQEFSLDTMEKALRRNPHWVDQIIEESDNLGNFS